MRSCGVVLVLSFWLSGCCDDALTYDPESREYNLSTPLNIGKGTGTGGLHIYHAPGGEWGYTFFAQVEGPNAANTKALAICTSKDTITPYDLFVVYGDGRGIAKGPFSFEAPITVKEIVARDTQRRWPDYVFSPGYRLRSLYELEAYIQKHQRLPGMPSADDIAQKGISVVESQRLMMEKIEELTLYVLSLQRQVDSLRHQLELRKHSCK
ncbi:MAG: hypothetical protein NZZ60_08710 [Bacteroidia bacterium]|nr:hypothetical protein [Bacteroidia bacterium]MCX7652850.1 hypothetical protein [Bacteroidia bacterium]MDW8417598.1 hypothetical protein [Bacteroidia bacterium]